MADQKLQAVIDVKDDGSEKMKKFGEETEKAFDKAKKSGEQFQKALETMSKGLIIFGGAITGAMGYAVSKAAEAQAQMASMDATLETMGKTGLEARDAILKAADATIQLGFDNEDAAVSITKLFQRTGDLAEATKLNNLAMDLARARHIGLEEASNAVGLALSGNTKVLKAFGVEVTDTMTPLEALGLLQEKVAGQSEKFADTFAGRMEVLKIKTDELWEKIGDQLLPKLTELAEWMGRVADKVLEWTAKHPILTQEIVIVTGVVGALTLALGTLGIALSFLAANPIILAIAGLALLGVAIYELWKNWEAATIMIKASIEELDVFLTEKFGFIWTTIKNFGKLIAATWSGIWESIKLAFVTWFEIFMGIMTLDWERIGKAIDEFKPKLKAIWGAVWDEALVIFGTWITEAKERLSQFIAEIPGMIANIPSMILSAVNEGISKAGGAIANYVASKAVSAATGGRVSTGAVSSAIGAVRSVISGKKAMGGRVEGGSSYLVGEVGAEVFRPDSPGTVSPASRSPQGDRNITINITGNTLLDEDAGEKIGDMIMNRLGMNTRLAF